MIILVIILFIISVIGFHKLLYAEKGNKGDEIL